MTQDAITYYILDNFADVRSASVYGDVFFFYNPAPEGPNEIYFATLKVSDNDFDQASGLNRMGAFRLNMGVRRSTFVRLFGSMQAVARANEEGVYDYSAVNELLPHPLYAGAAWVCILNPSRATFDERVAPLLGEAYERAVWQYEHRR
jgi:hypothetical protein